LSVEWVFVALGTVDGILFGWPLPEIPSSLPCCLLPKTSLRSKLMYLVGNATMGLLVEDCVTEVFIARGK